jgi:ectoine hydroxylase-related dioxygenase (phytanoyl-CoA dioxygenase family)
MSPIIDPPVSVTPDMISDYERDGVALVKQPFNTEWVDGIREAVERNLAQYEKTGSANCTITAAEGRARVFNSVMNEPFVRRWAIESPVAEICARVIASETARYYFDVTFCKMGGGEIGRNSRTGYHIDVSAFGFKGRQMPSFWLALTDVTPDDGPLVTALGSHKKMNSFYRPVYTPAPLIPGYKDLSEIYSFLDEHKFETKSWPMSKGDVLVLHPYMAHASVPMKRPDGRRFGLSTRWMGDDVRWRPNVYSEGEAMAHPHPLADGARPPEDWYPVMWDARRGYSAREKGAFNPFVTMETRAANYVANAAYTDTITTEAYY